MIPAREALERLKDGNRRFVTGPVSRSTSSRELIIDQKPYAVILGCSDSRVPPELLFDLGIGDAFVIRVAGNIVTPIELGSVEFAAIKFGPRLVVVLGHSQCGAVTTTVDALINDREAESPSLAEIVDRIGSTAHACIDKHPSRDQSEIVNSTIDANIKESVHALSHNSPILTRLMREEGLTIVGARYSVETGEVEFHDALSPACSAE